MGVFVLLLVAIFDTEMAVMEIHSTFFGRMGLVAASLLDAATLSLIYAVPLWFFFVQPLCRGYSAEEKRARIAPAGLFAKALAVIFLVEFLVMLLLLGIVPQAEIHVRNMADASLTIVLCTPLLWWLLFRPAIRRYRLTLDDLLGTPVKLYVLLLFMVFLVDMLQEQLAHFFSPDMEVLSNKITESFLTTLISAPFLWWFIVRPLKRTAQSEKTRADAVCVQVVDAIAIVDRQGMIESLNPAAERIFGYRADEITGKPANRLFDGDQRCLDEQVPQERCGDGGRVSPWTLEVMGRRRDGSLLTMDVSSSRVLLDGKPKFLVIMRDISDRIAMEKALRKSEERFDILVNGANEGIWDWNLPTGMLYCTSRFEELLGYREGELANTFEMLVSHIHQEDRERFMADIDTHLRDRASFDSEYRLLTKAGDCRWFRVRGQAVHDENSNAVRMVGSISDITKRKQAEEALRESETRFRQIFEQSEDAIIFFKPGTCSIIDVNSTAERLYGYTKAELLQVGLEGLCRPEDFARMSRAVCNIRRGEAAFLDKVANLRRDGTEFIVSMHGKVITLQGVDIIYCTFRDIGERIRLEEEALEIQAKLFQANKMTALGLMVSGVAHEINNPNNFIMANSQFLAMAWEDALKVMREYYRENGEFFVGGIPFSEMSEQAPRLMAGITDGARRINEIVNNLKRFASQDRIVAESEVDVNEVVTTAITILHHELVKHTERFHIDLAENIPHVRGSNQQLGQVVINLLMNACQALPAKECGIWVTTAFDAAAGEVTVTIRDEGSGMSPDVGNRILEPFFTTKLDKGGTGLGLAICQSIVKEHRGSLMFESEPGKGTTFIVRIPAGASAVLEGAT